MAEKSKIEWTEATWNPVSGCSPVSAGCANCYAARMSHRWAYVNARYVGLTEIQSNGVRRFNGTVRCHEDVLEQPLRWRKPRMIFVCSMADLFHPNVPVEFIDKVFATMTLCPQHTFQVLTKRPEREAEYATSRSYVAEEGVFGDNCIGNLINGPTELFLSDVRDMPGGNEHWRHTGADYELGGIGAGYWEWLGEGDVDALFPTWPLPNVWLGTTVENQEAADKRIPELLKCPAAVRFLSCEPLLDYLDLRPFLRPTRMMKCPCGNVFRSTDAQPCQCNPPCNCRSIDECYHHRHASFTLMCPQCGLCACDRKDRWVAEGRVGTVAGSEFDWCLDPEKWSKGIHQVIVGAETGPGARPMDPDWARSIRDQCRSAGVAFYMKQVSGKKPIPNDLMIREFPSVDCGG